jgi:hypothetical protein
VRRVERTNCHAEASCGRLTPSEQRAGEDHFFRDAYRAAPVLR